MRLVKFNNGKWGVQYGFLYHTYQDFVTPCFHWNIRSEYIGDCQVDEMVARNYYNYSFNNKVIPEKPLRVEKVITSNTFFSSLVKRIRDWLND